MSLTYVNRLHKPLLPRPEPSDCSGVGCHALFSE
jgi:hypothetical protein